MEDILNQGTTPEETSTETAEEMTENEETSGADSEEIIDTSAENDAPFMTVRFNHEDKDFNRDDATNYVQKGLNYDRVSPLLDKVNFLAAQTGKTATEFLEDLDQQAEDSYRQSVTDKFDGDNETVESLVELWKNKRHGNFDTAKKAVEESENAKKASYEQKLADSFVELQAEFPELEKFENLPRDVKKDVANGKDLMSSYLLHLRREQQKVDAAKKQKETATDSSSGTSKTGEVPSPAITEFMKGLWN